MENRAFNMDCMEAMRSMPDQCFDLAVVDPPYGIKISNNMGRRKGERPSEYKKVTWDDAPPPPEYFTELVRVSKNQIIFGANHFVSLIPAADSSCWICWDKGFSSEVSFASFELAWTSFDRPMRSMPDQCFDLAVVDPPYGIKISNNMGRRKGERPSEYKKVTWDDAPPPPEYFTELVRVSKNQIIFGANHFVSLIPAADSSCWICWDKGFSSEVSFASFELAWTSFDRPSKRVALSSAQAGRIHPTQKPVALYAWIFQHYAKPGDRILDTHLGSGSSRIAAWDAGLDFTGYEIDPEYFEAQEKRFQQHTAQMSLFGGGGI